MSLEEMERKRKLKSLTGSQHDHSYERINATRGNRRTGPLTATVNALTDQPACIGVENIKVQPPITKSVPLSQTHKN